LILYIYLRNKSNKFNEITSINQLDNRRILLYITPVFLFATILLAADFSTIEDSSNSEAKTEEVISSSNEENFNKMMMVITHKRCVNCHPSDNVPKQGEDSHPHYFGMSRGEGSLGFEATNGKTCYQDENNDFSGVPDTPEWSLALASRKWEGLSSVEIA
jgi:hypothetical protein